MHKKSIVLIFALILGLAVVAGTIFPGTDSVVRATAMTELNVSNLSCGSCVTNIQNALADIDGVGQVDVSVTNGRSQVIYDPALASSKQIAEVITDAGYPATVRLDLSGEEYASLQAENAQLSSSYVARVGKRLISREDFNQRVSLRSGAGLADSPARIANAQLQAQVWQELKDREVLLTAADKNQVVVQDGEVEMEIEEIRAATRDFDAAIKNQFGNFERFFSRVKENMIIKRNIEQNVTAGLSDGREKQSRFSQWFDETLRDTTVVIFDPALKLATSTGSSSCGGSCCGS